VHHKNRRERGLFMAGRVNQFLENMSERATRRAGSSWAFGFAMGIIVVWLISGPAFGFSDTWQLVINTGTTIVTFLMVFLIKITNNNENQATQLKLNEIVAAVKGASNRLIDLEDWKEDELRELHEHYRRLAYLAQTDPDSHRSLSVDSADERHNLKRKEGKKPTA
jgi:low affinity Fe/Cu permease